MKLFRLALFAGMSLVLTACNLPRATPGPPFDPNAVATMVQETLAGFPTPAPRTAATEAFLPTASAIPLPSPTSSTGKAAGKICFPASGRADMRGFFQDTASGVVTELAISAGDTKYEIELEAGSYIAYAWPLDFSIGGMYSSGKQPTPFTISAGQTTLGIDLCDWTHGPFDVPYPPGYAPQQTTGSISGTLTYPFGSLPQLTVVAFGKNTPYWYWVGTLPGQGTYTIDDLPPGKYQVVAYDGSGHAGGSALVTVSAGQTSSADVSDWSGSYPANPVK